MAIDIDRAVSAVTLAGSLISYLATTFVLISFIIYRHHLQSFRHVLILELVIFENINSLNNSVSGIWFLKNGELKPGDLCTVNGFVGQLSAQVVDFSILAIALVTLLTVTRFIYIPSTSTTRKTFICITICVLPLTTSLIPTFEGEMKPVGGNWCWISASRPDLRYGMAHGWRLFVIFATILIYIYIWAYLRQHLNSKPTGTQKSPRNPSMGCNINSVFSNRPKRMGFQVMTDEEAELDVFNLARENKPASSSVVFEDHQSPRPQEDRGHDTGNQRPNKAGESEASQSRTRVGSIRHRPTASNSGSELVFLEAPNDGSVGSSQTKRQSHTRRQSQINVLQTNASEFPMRPRTHEVEIEIKRMMLLNAYPIMYVILWAPGLVNRLMEASGNPNSKTTIAALQASTQFVGLANALTYGFNHYLRDRLNDLYVRPMIVRIKKRFGSY